MKPTRFLALLALFASIAALALSAYQRQLWTSLEPFNGTEAEAFQRGRLIGWREAAASFRRERESATNFSPAIAWKIDSVLAEKLFHGDSPVSCETRGDRGERFQRVTASPDCAEQRSVKMELK